MSQIDLLPLPSSLFTVYRMSCGATNWPFLTLIVRPVRAAATSRSVWRQRNAGIWITSRTSAARSTSCMSWTSLITSTPTWSLTDFRIRRPSSRPGPRNESSDVRLALS